MIEAKTNEVQNNSGEIHPLLPTVPCNVVYHEDCMEGLKRFPDNYFDLAVVDPPYGINMGKFKTMGKKGKTYSTSQYKQSNWDANIPTPEYFNQLQRVSKNQIVWGGNYFINMLYNTPCFIVWDKHYIPEGFTMSDVELAWTSFSSPSKKLRVARNKVANCVSNNIKRAKINAKIHQAQKPIELYDWIFNNYASNGNLILDTHLGSGSSRIAAHKAGLSFVGFEIDADYYAAQEKRFKTFTSQLRMF